MTETTFRHIVWLALLLLAPALLFLIQVFYILPPALLLTGSLFMFKKSILAGFGTENLTFLAFFLIHFLLYAGLYWLLAFLLGKISNRLPAGGPRTALLVALLLILGLTTQLPIYGGGGHGPARLGSLQFLLSDLANSYDRGALTVACLATGAALTLPLLWRWWRLKSTR